MKLIRSALCSADAVLSRQCQNPNLIRAFSANPSRVPDELDILNSLGTLGNSEQRNSNVGDRSSMHSFYEKIDQKQAQYRSNRGSSFNFGNKYYGQNEGYNSLADGLNDKLQKAAAYFEFDPAEVTGDNYSFRPDVNFNAGMTYDPKDLDLSKPGVRKPIKRYEFETTTEEVLLKADFRNVKFLANFITEAGVIIKRSKTGISAKAQRKVAREIKTARAFGLMPFTTMGTKQFIYGQTMENVDRDFEFEAASSYDHNFVDDDSANVA